MLLALILLLLLIIVFGGLGIFVAKLFFLGLILAFLVSVLAGVATRR